MCFNHRAREAEKEGSLGLTGLIGELQPMRDPDSKEMDDIPEGDT